MASGPAPASAAQPAGCRAGARARRTGAPPPPTRVVPVRKATRS